MPDLSQPLLAVCASRLADQIWSVRDSSLQRYLGEHAAGSIDRIEPERVSAEPERRGAVAVFRVAGMLVPRATWRGEVDSFALAQALDAAARDEAVTAGVLLIDSPGGVCHGMHELVAASKRFAAAKATWVTHVEGCCCSAAYELASTTHKIFAGPRDDIGSIGTRSLIYDFSKYFAELGVEAVVSDTGAVKSIGALGTAVTEAQRAFLKRRVDYLQQDFKACVTEGRGFSDAQYETVATGEWWFGEQAVELGLIDGVQDFQQTFAGVESALTTKNPKPRSQPMSDKANENHEPQAATTSELKKQFPNSTAEWREAQTENAATLAEAAVAYAKFQEEEAEKAKAEAAAATERAEKAEQAASKNKQEEAAPAKSQRGVPSMDQSTGDDEESAGPVDYRALAKQMVKDEGLSYREAARRVQKRYGTEARKAFVAGRLPG